MNKKRLHCRNCYGCLGLVKTETSKRITYECKVPKQDWEEFEKEKVDG